MRRRRSSRRSTATRTSSATPISSCSTPAQAGDVPAPAPDVLAKYFDERKVLFRAPEFRKVTILALTPDAIAPSIEIADSEVKDIYDKNPNLFGTPEKRDVQQILFFDKDAAHKAAERLRAAPRSTT